MHRRRAKLAAFTGLIVYAVVCCADVAWGSTLCESRGNPAGAASEPAVPATASVNPPVQTAPAVKKPAAHRVDHDNTVVAAGGSSPAPGDDDAAANLGTPGAGVHRHGLRWQSLLPGVIK